MKMRIAVLGAMLFTVATMGVSSLKANQSDIDAYFTIDSVNLYEVSDGQEVLVDQRDGASAMVPAPAPTLIPRTDAAGGGTLGTIITLGEKVWNIIEKNKPVVNQNYAAVSAVPAGIRSWEELTGWSEPVIRNYKLLYTNKFNQKVVEFTYRVAYTYNGSLDGKGKYLSRVEIDHTLLNVAWGYKFTAGGEALNITNMGTKEAPLAAMEIRLNWGVDTLIKHMDQSVRYYVRGDGLFKSLTDGNMPTSK